MDHPPPPIRELSRRLLVLEAGGRKEAEARAGAAVRVCQRLQTALSRLVGPDGFAALMRRTLVLAKREVPALANLQIQGNGDLAGFEPLAAATPDHGSAAATAITAHLLHLLVTFIGEPLTYQIVRETWPQATWDDTPGPAQSGPAQPETES